MCGIAAFFAYHYAAPDIDREDLSGVANRMNRRGPDGRGEWFSTNGRVAMAHRRLSIIDLSERGAQPMKTPDGNLVISFNGEIYNYKELRRRLEAAGRHFFSGTDTEVLLHLYDEMGESMVHELRGMFAFAIWDERKQKIFLARDPYGIKPLYYADDGWTIRVASQVKALLASNRVSRQAEPAASAGFLMTGSVPEPFTFFQEIRQLPAGSTLTVDSNGPSVPARYFSISDIYRQAQSISPKLSVTEALVDSVRAHFVADVSVGIFLSSGIDSTVLTGLARDAGFDNIKTVTLSFEEFKGTADDEAPLAKTVASHYGMRHEIRVVTSDEANSRLNDFFEVMDQPSIDGLNTYLVSLAAKEAGLKVALSGVGADELFGGYSSFRDIPRMTGALVLPSRIPFAGRNFRAATFALPARHAKLRGLVALGGTYPGAYLLKRGLFMPWELPLLMKKDEAREGLRRLEWMKSAEDALMPDSRNAFAKISSLESSFYMRNQLLRDADWAGMAHSLEIRTPYVDARLLRAVAPYLVGRKSPGKSELAASPKKALPPQVTSRPKTGFRVPIGEWLSVKKELDGWNRVPMLRGDCHWSRRWAYVVSCRMKEAA